MIPVFTTPEALREWRAKQTQSVGFVPTMGALHSGHAELLKKARQDNELLVLSIFVNPTQFNNPDDLAAYPKTWEADLSLAEAQGVDAIFLPQYQGMYPDGYRYKVSENSYSEFLDGAHRPGHFDGVLSVVMKLFNLVKPQRAYFGEKDYQQLKLIEGMVAAFFMDLRIVPVATVREDDGLAKSSRNTRLTAEQRQKAPMIYKIITQKISSQEAANLLNQNGFDVDYVTDLEGRRFVAAKLGDVRLIDNVKI